MTAPTRNLIFADPTTAENGMLVCASPDRSMFADDLAAACAVCRSAIVHRPHAVRFKTKVCERCGVAYMRSPMGGNANVGVTRETLAELKLYYASTGRRQ